MFPLDEMQASLLIVSKMDTYLPFFFQDYQGVSATASGARFLILIGPQIGALMLSSALAGRGFALVSFEISSCVIS